MKDWYKSKTVWSGILKAVSGLALLAVSLLNGDVTVAEGVVSGASILWGAVDILIRYKTVQPLK